MKSGDVLDCLDEMSLEELKRIRDDMSALPDIWLIFRTVTGWCMVPSRDVACIKLPES